MKIGPLDLPVANVNQLAMLVLIIALVAYGLKAIPATSPVKSFKLS